jgi:glycosyltransferase involved in cell wall biosynthesis
VAIAVNGNGTLNGHLNGNGHGWDRGLVGAERRDAARKVKVSVIVPTLNEARNLPHVLPRIPKWVHEVVLVDGGSVDDTVEVAKTLLPDVRVVGQERPGKGAALQAGFKAAKGEIIVTIDADGSTDPAEIPVFVGCLLGGADFVKGSRFMQGGGTDDMELVRRAGNWVLRGMVRAAFGGRYSDLCYGYNAFWRRVLPVIDGEADGFEIETLMNVRVLAAGMKVAEVPSHEARRIHGLSNLSTFRDGYRVLRVIVRERTRLRGRGRPAGPRGRLNDGSPIVDALANSRATTTTELEVTVDGRI